MRSARQPRRCQVPGSPRRAGVEPDEGWRTQKPPTGSALQPRRSQTPGRAQRVGAEGRWTQTILRHTQGAAVGVRAARSKHSKAITRNDPTAWFSCAGFHSYKMRLVPYLLRAARSFVRRLLNPSLLSHIPRSVRRRAAVVWYQASVPHVLRGAPSGGQSCFPRKAIGLLPPKSTRGAQRRFLGSANDYPAPHDGQGAWCLESR